MNYIVTIKYEDAPLNGVIHYLYNKYQHDLYFLRYIHVRASSTYKIEGWNELAPVDPSKTGTSTSDSWASTNTKNSNYSIFFPRHTLIITDYTLQTQSNHLKDHPKTWVLEGSKDGINWYEIDHQQNVQETNQQIQYPYTVNINKTIKTAYSHFRFTQTDVNHGKRDFFDIGKIEFFGKLIHIRYFLKSCSTTNKYKFIYFIYIILIK